MRSVFLVLSFVLVNFIPTLAMAETFKLSLTISNVDDMQGAKARVFIFVANNSGVPLQIVSELGQSDRNRLKQFHLSIESLSFVEGESRGFLYADVLNSSDVTTRRVPLTYFDESQLTTNRWLNISAPALEGAGPQFKDSYPVYLNETSLFSDQNSNFLLSAMRTLITNGFVTESQHWDRLFNIFKSNVSYFKEGSAEKLFQILLFLEDRYGSDKASLAFVNFYLELLSRIMTLDIEGRGAPGSISLESYIIARISTVFSEQPNRAMEGSARVLLEFMQNEKYDACFILSQSLLKSLALTSSLYDEIQQNRSLGVDFKRILKRSIDCAQRKYVNDLDSDPQNAFMGNLKGGVDYLVGENEQTKAMLMNFLTTFNKADAKALFPRKEDNGDWKQVYVYYDLIRAAGIGDGDQS